MQSVAQVQGVPDDGCSWLGVRWDTLQFASVRFTVHGESTEVKSAYQLLARYLRREHGFTHDQVDEVVDRLEEQVAEHIIEIHEDNQA